MLTSRLDQVDVRGWATFNPGHPVHWFRRKVLDDADQWQARIIKFSLDDNPSLAAETKARFKRQYRGAFAARMIHGEWAAAEGLCYPFWTAASGSMLTDWVERFEYHMHGWPRQKVGRVWSLDYGVATTMACVGARCAAVTESPDDATKHRSTWVIDREYYYDSRDHGRSRTEVEHIAQLRKLVPRGATIIVDPTSPETFKRQLREAGWPTRLGNNENVLEGIVRTGALLANEALLVDVDQAPRLADELQGYRWKPDQEEDVPQKAFDHACDAMRYLGMFLERFTMVHPGIKHSVPGPRRVGRPTRVQSWIMDAEPGTDHPPDTTEIVDVPQRAQPRDNVGQRQINYYQESARATQAGDTAQPPAQAGL